MIPKKIHQIWLGGKPLPPRESEWQQGWIERHPDWEYKLWTDQEISDHGWDQTFEVEKADSWSCKSDIYRFAILMQYGGVYLDTDMECIGSLDTLNLNKDFICAPQEGEPPDPKAIICGAFLACKPMSHAIRLMYHTIPYRQMTFGDKNASGKFGPWYVTDILHRKYSFSRSKWFTDDIEYLSRNSFFAGFRKKGSEKTDEILQAKESPTGIGLHHWNKSW